MYNPYHINDAYSDFFNDWFQKHITRSSHAYFVTITFEHEAKRRQRRQAEGLSQGCFEREAFKHLYSMACRALIGRNYHRAYNASRLPPVLMFLDADGSKYWRSKGELTNLHLHSVWLIEEDQTEAFERLMALDGPSKDTLRNLSIDQVDVKPIDPSQRVEVKRVISYASKLTGFTNQDLPLGSDFEVYPLNGTKFDEDEATAVDQVSPKFLDRNRTTSFSAWLKREREQGA